MEFKRVPRWKRFLGFRETQGSPDTVAETDTVLTLYLVGVGLRGTRENACMRTRFSLVVNNERADAGNRTAEPVSRGQILRRERGQGNLADPEQD